LPEGDTALYRRARRRIYWLLVVVLVQLADWLPVGLGRLMCAGLARVAVRLRPAERRVAQANLARAFPEIDAKERERLLEESAEALGWNLFDTLAARRLLDRDGVVVEEPGPGTSPGGVGEILAGLAAQGRGVFILTGHLGCWELLGGWLARELSAHGLAGLGVVTGTVRNPPVDRLLQGRRRALGMTVLPRHEGAGPLLRYLKAGGVVAVLQDQNTQVQNVEVPFFGEPAPTPAGLAKLALRYRIPVLPVAIARDRRSNRHLVVHRPAMAFKESSDPDEQVKDFLIRCNAELEKFIRRNPTEWVWFHHRWKS
jgi:KDO2-lipid IV(A) lauroyltransferase